MSPNGWFSQPVFIPGGNPETMNEPTLAKPGQLGIRFSYINPPRSVPSEGTEDGQPKAFKLVQTDSTMAVAPYDSAVAWFKDQARNIVTTSPTALGRGRVAGVFKTAVTPGYFCCVQVKGPAKTKIIDVPTAAPTAAGLFVVPSSEPGKADVITAGAAATYPPLGRTASSIDLGDSTCIVDLDVPEVL